MSEINNKIIVFDLDETLGYFSQLYILWRALINLSKTKLSVTDFYKLCDIYHFYYHPEIINILNYLHEQNIKPIIYTNNQALHWWPKLITFYLNHKISVIHNKKVNLFQDVIGSYTLNGYYNDKRRTSNAKKYSDLVRIINTSEKMKILFLDDQEHPEMRHNNVEYIQVPQYINVLPANIIINTFLNNPYGKHFITKNQINIQFFINYIFNEMKRHGCLSVNLIRIYKNINLFEKIKNFVKTNVTNVTNVKESKC